MSKGCDDSAIIGPILQRQHMPNDAGNRCLVGAELRQSGHIWQMTWPIVDVIVALSSYVALAPGDPIMTGTPAGVGPVAPERHALLRLIVNPRGIYVRGLT